MRVVTDSIKVGDKTYEASQVLCENGGEGQPEGTITIVSNGKHDVYDYAEADVQVPLPLEQSKSVTPTRESIKVVPDSGYLLKEVNVGAIPGDYVQVAGEVDITENGTYDVTNFVRAKVNVGGGEQVETKLQILETDENGKVLRAKLTGVTEVANFLFSTTSGGGTDSSLWSAFRTMVSVDLPNDLIRIGRNSFSGCISLRITELPDSITIIDSYAFGGGQTNLPLSKLPSSLITLGTNVFEGCTNLPLTELPDALETVGEKCFRNCTNMPLQKLSSNLKTIGNSAFYVCSGFTGSLIIPNSVTTIDNYAFDGCKELTTITIPASLESLGSCAFNTCYKLAEVNFAPNSKLKSIGSTAFAQCSVLTTITIPSGVTSMGSYCFDRCTSLVSVYLPDNVSVIGRDFFNQCKALTTVKMPTNLKEIGCYAFDGCIALKSIYIPASVTKIDCMYDDGDLDGMPFDGCDNLVIYCGVSSAPSGYESGWNAYGYSNGENLTVKYGYTYQQYLTAIGG